MDSPDKRFSEIVDTVKSWIPRRTEPANLSRDFWMPDQSCRVCYECDAQFTVFNRKHHCRLCGRVFCAKCTSNSIPAPSDDPTKTGREDLERIRVCNYCYKQWGEQEMLTVDNGIQASTSGLSPSPSTTSLASSKSSVTVNSSNSTVGSMPYSTGPYQHVSNGSVLSPRQSVQAEQNTHKSDVASSRMNMDPMADVGDPSSGPFGYCMNRHPIVYLDRECV
ncbi:hypothetical protein GIB67_009651 [Kingdonia uniflora]|uniref:Phosphatidylinositol 3-phosphate 5-kinase type III n=1 Tax=Kingdonia uniflora TaxID=39325 RepID=A0A7J7LBA6_9MAGN|nr:hypothetical protein GIB67_009651 [Kingdonia uniflora]